MPKNALANALVLLVSSLMALVLFEAGGRRLFRDQLRAIRDVDHRPPRNTAETNDDGIRSKVDPDEVRPEDSSVVFLGDSFAYGFRLPPEETVPQLLEREARRAFPDRTVRVFNFGWISSSPRLSLRRLRDVGARYEPDSVILLVDATRTTTTISGTGVSSRGVGSTGSPTERPSVSGR